MLIINDTKLSNRAIGLIIDKLKEDKNDTHYFGEVEIARVTYRDKPIKVQIRYLKKYVEWRFWYE